MNWFLIQTYSADPSLMGAITHILLYLGVSTKKLRVFQQSPLPQ